MPRERSPHLKFARKRQFLPSSNVMKRSAPLQRMRSSSRSPLRKRSLSFRSISPRREHSDEFSKYSGRQYGHAMRLPMKRPKMHMIRKHSLSPRKDRSPTRKCHSPFRKSPTGKPPPSLCFTDDRDARRQGENYHRDARYCCFMVRRPFSTSSSSV